jgi:hypothetical protein
MIDIDFDDDDFNDFLARAVKGKSDDPVPKRLRSLNWRSQSLIEKMKRIIEPVQPITGRGVGYKLFVAKIIPSMSRPEMQKVYRLLKEARERGIIPWEWIVDETRELERTPSWKNKKLFAKDAIRQYRRDFWEQQPSRCEVWSEKGTIRGVLKPVLDRYGVGFRVMHGYGSATAVNEVAAAIDYDDRQLTALYVGDYDPSGLHMSEADLPKRLAEYGGHHVEVKRIALIKEQLGPLDALFFPVKDKWKDPRYNWFVYDEDYGDRCWEIDALDPNELRNQVEANIKDCILDPVAWERCVLVNNAERDSLQDYLTKWGNIGGTND